LKAEKINKLPFIAEQAMLALHDSLGTEACRSGLSREAMVRTLKQLKMIRAAA